MEGMRKRHRSLRFDPDHKQPARKVCRVSATDAERVAGKRYSPGTGA